MGKLERGGKGRERGKEQMMLLKARKEERFEVEEEVHSVTLSMVRQIEVSDIAGNGRN